MLRDGMVVSDERNAGRGRAVTPADDGGGLDGDALSWGSAVQDRFARDAVFDGQIYLCDAFGCNWRGGADGRAGVLVVVPDDAADAGAVDSWRRTFRRGCFSSRRRRSRRGWMRFAPSGVEISTVTELLSMASAPKTLDPLLVRLKAVDPAQYPFYGDGGAGAGDAAWSRRLAAESVAVGEDLLVRLGLQVGDQLKMGGKLFRIAAMVVNEPDRLSGNFAAGPRVLISRDGSGERPGCWRRGAMRRSGSCSRCRRRRMGGRSRTGRLRI